ncbi:uncharacterized protein [Spinacia oleracea]|uniref:DNA-directed RNA polymerase n=1 Tax=Spinacia oleracea TaxID=3562 RepID=A0A9R0ILZ4_SPIOL|nr:uncharacterized protein LOC110791382 [Spinacia oleracea]
MGSLEEEKLLQMVHDFIESSSDSNTSSSSLLSPTRKHAHSTTFFTLQEILKKKTEEEKEIHEKVEKLMRNKMGLEKTSGLKKWVVSCLEFHGFRASFCHSSWITTPSCPCGNYEYIEVVKEGDGQRVIVDMDLKSQFEVARPTQSYTQLLSKVPIIFVGNEVKLKRIISLLCSAAEHSLKERGLHIPPWRRAVYMQSKWKLSNSTNYNNNNTNNNNNNNPRLEKWVPQNVMRRRGGLTGGGSGLSNQFSNLSINCC